MKTAGRVSRAARVLSRSTAPLLVVLMLAALLLRPSTVEARPFTMGDFHRFLTSDVGKPNAAPGRPGKSVHKARKRVRHARKARRAHRPPNSAGLAAVVASGSSAFPPFEAPSPALDDESLWSGHGEDEAQDPSTPDTSSNDEIADDDGSAGDEPFVETADEENGDGGAADELETSLLEDLSGQVVEQNFDPPGDGSPADETDAPVMPLLASPESLPPATQQAGVDGTNAVPEPASVGLMGVAMLVAWRSSARRRRRAPASV